MPGDRTLPGLRPAPLALPLALLAALSVACGGDALPWTGDAAYGDGTWHGTMDTLEDGTVVVRNPAQGIWTEEQAWRIEEELRIGARGGQGPEVFGRISALAVDSLGRVWVADAQAGEIRVFDRDGGHVRTVGGPGEGPGEFSSPTGLEMDGRGRVVMVDPGNQRYSVLDTAARFVESRPRPEDASRMFGFAWLTGFTGDGRFWDVGGSVFNPDARLRLIALDSAFRETGSRPLPPADPGAHSYDVWTLDPAGHVWIGPPEQFRIVKRELPGDTVRIVERDVEPRELTEEERQERLEGMKSRMARTPGGSPREASPGDVPTHADLYSRFAVDDAGRLWVEPGAGGSEGVDRMHVFDPEGRYLGPVRLDARITGATSSVFDGAEVWFVTHDDQDVEYVVRGRIVRPDDGG